ncbi:MAG TPA: MOSC domain-containing protein [Vicinamibacterales bacterium]
MSTPIGHVEAIFRYPVKSMRGEALHAADLGWHGIEGDRRLALRRVDDRSGFPWLTATKLPALLTFAPCRSDDGQAESLPKYVRTPEGTDLAIFGHALTAEIGRRHGAAVHMMEMRHGIFDDACVSVIATATVDEIGRRAERPADVRRFRPNIVVRLMRPGAFQEDEWVGGVLSFGDDAEALRVAVTMRDLRCSMVNYDPDTAHAAPEILKAIVRANDGYAGIYGAVTRIGRIAIGQPVLFDSARANG